MSKQTAVNFLIKEFSDILGPLDTKPMQDLLLVDAIKQAKEMEKEQNELTCINVIETILDKKEKNEIIDSKQIFEEYYNETYGKQTDSN